jgi:hypothetical protein
MISISKIMVPLQFSGFLLYVVKFALLFVTYVKNIPRSTAQDLSLG